MRACRYNFLVFFGFLTVFFCLSRNDVNEYFPYESVSYMWCQDPPLDSHFLHCEPSTYHRRENNFFFVIISAWHYLCHCPPH